MVTDFAASLSRKKEDKINGTGRWHIMKNRYGMDGLTFGTKADVSTGTFEIVPEEELENMQSPQPQSYINEGSENFSLETRETAAQFLSNI